MFKSYIDMCTIHKYFVVYLILHKQNFISFYLHYRKYIIAIEKENLIISGFNELKFEGEWTLNYFWKAEIGGHRHF